MIKELLTGGLFSTIEGIATEWIETNQEKAEAQAVMIKALDPNGKLRRVVTLFTCFSYGWYLLITSLMVLLSAWGAGGEMCTTAATATECRLSAEIAASMLTELFLPITTAFGAIVGASFGVNYKNSAMGK